jgi:hypothetical protein
LSSEKKFLGAHAMTVGMSVEQRESVLQMRAKCLHQALWHGTLAEEFQRARDGWLACNVFVVFSFLFVTFPLSALFVAGRLSIAWAFFCLFTAILALFLNWWHVERNNNWRMRHEQSSAWFLTLAECLLDEQENAIPNNDFIHYIFQQYDTTVAQTM